VPNTNHCVQKSNLNTTQIIINDFDDSKYDSHKKNPNPKHKIKKKNDTKNHVEFFFLV
jgi:hypothetical protein